MVETIEKTRTSGQHNSAILGQIEGSIHDFVRAFESIADSASELSSDSQEINRSMLKLNQQSVELMDKNGQAQDSIVDANQMLQDILGHADRSQERLAILTQQSREIELVQRECGLMTQLGYTNIKEILRRLASFKLTQEGLAQLLSQCDFGQIFAEIQHLRKQVHDLLAGTVSPAILQQEIRQESHFLRWSKSVGVKYFRDLLQLEELQQVYHDATEAIQEILQLVTTEKKEQASALLPQFYQSLVRLQEGCLIMQRHLHEKVIPQWLHSWRESQQQSQLDSAEKRLEKTLRELEQHQQKQSAPAAPILKTDLDLDDPLPETEQKNSIPPLPAPSLPPAPGTAQPIPATEKK